MTALGCRPAPEPPDAGPVETQPLLTLQGFTKEVGGVAFSPDGKRLAAAEFLGEMTRVFEPSTGKELLTIKRGRKGGRKGPLRAAPVFS